MTGKIIQERASENSSFCFVNRCCLKRLLDIAAPANWVIGSMCSNGDFHILTMQRGVCVAHNHDHHDHHSSSHANSRGTLMWSNAAMLGRSHADKEYSRRIISTQQGPAKLFWPQFVSQSMKRIEPPWSVSFKPLPVRLLASCQSSVNSFRLAVEIGPGGSRKASTNQSFPSWGFHKAPLPTALPA
jgi:hypothetical protein